MHLFNIYYVILEAAVGNEKPIVTNKKDQSDLSKNIVSPSGKRVG